ncbi:MAG TPA: PilZ domain-containing protein [Devosia sp.]
MDFLRLEKRLAPRRNTLIRAVLVYNGGRGRTECIIRNLSAGGAKLEFTGSVASIPNTFDLFAPGHRPHPCRVVWRSLKELGVQFRE